MLEKDQLVTRSIVMAHGRRRKATTFCKKWKTVTGKFPRLPIETLLAQTRPWRETSMILLVLAFLISHAQLMVTCFVPRQLQSPPPPPTNDVKVKGICFHGLLKIAFSSTTLLHVPSNLNLINHQITHETRERPHGRKKRWICSSRSNLGHFRSHSITRRDDELKIL